MKFKVFNTLLVMTALSALISCNTKETKVIEKTTVTTPAPTTPGTSGGGSGNPLHQFNLVLAGHQNWVPGTYSNPLAQETMITIKEASLLFKSDNRLKIKLKVAAQPSPTTGQEYCYGRQTGQAGDADNYTKLKFKVKLRDVICNSIDPSNSSHCLSGFQLGSAYRTQFIGPINVEAYSPVIDLGSYRNRTPFGTVVEVSDVTADSTCQANDTFCPAEKIVRAASCWQMKMFVSTDYTQDMQ